MSALCKQRCGSELHPPSTAREAKSAIKPTASAGPDNTKYYENFKAKLIRPGTIKALTVIFDHSILLNTNPNQLKTE